MAYSDPIVRTYRSKIDYRRDAARMALFGFQVMNVRTDHTTDSLRMAAILIVGLLLTPVLVGLLILLLLPTAFSLRITVYYLPALSGPPLPVISMGVPAPLTRQLTPGRLSDETTRDADEKTDRNSRRIALSWGEDYLYKVRAFVESCSPLQRITLLVAAIAVVGVAIVLSATTLPTLLHLHL